MTHETISNIEQSVAPIVVALGERLDWKTMRCSLQLLALGLLAVDIPDAKFARLLNRSEKYEKENPVLGFTAFSVYSRMYLARVREAVAECDKPHTQTNISSSLVPDMTEAA